ncbi:MAG: rhamnulokinase [Phycisphaeraceae bacterium]|nr:rhamnulokinase [Phycisphaeraceae bacterium]
MGASKRGYVAFDLGAESGRAMLATFDGRRIELGEQHRFANRTIRLPDGLHWDLTGLWAHLLEGLSKSIRAAADQGVTITSLGVDTWGVDYGLIGKSGQLLGLPFAYRDDRNPPAMAATLKKLGEKRIYDVTGIQFMPFNTLYQLVAQQQSEPALLEHARHILTMPDLLQYFFSGQAVNEATDASTTQMIDPRSGTWAKELIASTGVPTHFLGGIVPAGTKIGSILPGVAAETGCPPEVAVIAPGTHDTASAVAAVPAETGKGNWAYLSSGTWSLMGAEIDEPAISPATLAAQFTHERGVGGKIRFLKNIAGLWLVQECRRDLEKQGQSLDYETLTVMAAKSLPFRTLVDPDHGPFGTPGDMLTKIRDFARKTGQPEPIEPGQFVRCCLESLALRYRQVMDLLEQLLGRKFERLHIVGGGGKNTLLNQMTADALGRPVIVGPYEATAIGNALTQAMGAGQIKDLAQLRQVVRDSFELTTVEPKDSAAFANHLERFAKMRV